MIYTTGYGLWNDPDAFAEEVRRLGARVIDIRFRPWSRQPRWREHALQELLGTSYSSLPALGNANYRSRGPVRLQDPDRGLAAVLDRATRGPVILLCACSNPSRCHRRLVAAALRERGADVAELATHEKSSKKV